MNRPVASISTTIVNSLEANNELLMLRTFERARLLTRILLATPC